MPIATWTLPRTFGLQVLPLHAWFASSSFSSASAYWPLAYSTVEHGLDERLGLLVVRRGARVAPDAKRRDEEGEDCEGEASCW